VPFTRLSILSSLVSLTAVSPMARRGRRDFMPGVLTPESSERDRLGRHSEGQPPPRAARLATLSAQVCNTPGLAPAGG
jgi:hypothetical protein